jgi:hypothetical protein
VIPNIRLSYDSVTILYSTTIRVSTLSQKSNSQADIPEESAIDHWIRRETGTGSLHTVSAKRPATSPSSIWTVNPRSRTNAWLPFLGDIPTFHLSTMFGIILRTAAYCSRIACSCANNCWICEGTSRISEDADARWVSLTGRLICCGSVVSCVTGRGAEPKPLKRLLCLFESSTVLYPEVKRCIPCLYSNLWGRVHVICKLAARRDSVQNAQDN